MGRNIEFQRSTLGAAASRLQPALALIEQLQGGSRLRLNWTDIRIILDQLTNGHFWIGYPLPSGYSIFRGRVNATNKFENVRQLSFRPSKDVRDYGRCHRPAFSVFYGSNNLDTVLAELDPQIGDRVHVAVVKLKDNKRLNLTAIGEIDHVRRFGRPLIGNNQSRDLIQSFLKRLESESPKENDIKTLLLDAFLSDLFIASARRQSDYKATSALSDIIFSMGAPQSNVRFDGFAYPSVAHRGGLNFAISAESFAESMEIYRCFAVEITDYLGFGIYGRKVYARSVKIVQDGNIEWDN